MLHCGLSVNLKQASLELKFRATFLVIDTTNLKISKLPYQPHAHRGFA